MLKLVGVRKQINLSEKIKICGSKPMPLPYVKAISFLISMAFVFQITSWAYDSSIYVAKQSSIYYNNKIITIPKKLGTIDKRYQAGSRTVIHIQDLHCHQEVQLNIATMLNHLAQEAALSLVAVEGAHDLVRLEQLADFPIQRVKEEVGRYYIKQGKLTGAEYAAATSKHKLILHGIENKAYYHASQKQVRAFLNSESQGYSYDLRNSLEGLKASVYNKTLLAHDRLRTQFRNGKRPLLSYSVNLYQRGKKSGMALDRYPTIETFISKRQALFSPDVDSDRLMSELDLLEQQLRARLYTSDQQITLDQLIGKLDIIEKLLSISVTTEELQTYRAAPQTFEVANFLNFISQHQGEQPFILDSEMVTLNQYLKQVNHFYELADKRSQAFIDNTLACMDYYQADIAVLVSGGFHSEHVLSALQAKGISYLSIKPNLTKWDNINPYFSLLQGKQTPLEKLLLQNQTIMSLPTTFLQGPGDLKQLLRQSPQQIRADWEKMDIIKKQALLASLVEQLGHHDKTIFTQAMKTLRTDPHQVEQYTLEQQIVDGKQGRTIFPITDLGLAIVVEPRDKINIAQTLTQWLFGKEIHVSLVDQTISRDLIAQAEQNADNQSDVLMLLPVLELSFWEKYTPWLPKVFRSGGEELLFRVLPMLIFFNYFGSLYAAAIALGVSATLFLLLHQDKGWRVKQWFGATVATLIVSSIYFTTGLGLDALTQMPWLSTVGAFPLAWGLHSLNNSDVVQSRLGEWLPRLSFAAVQPIRLRVAPEQRQPVADHIRQALAAPMVKRMVDEVSYRMDSSGKLPAGQAAHNNGLILANNMMEMAVEEIQENLIRTTVNQALRVFNWLIDSIIEFWTSSKAALTFYPLYLIKSSNSSKLIHGLNYKEIFERWKGDWNYNGEALKEYILSKKSELHIDDDVEIEWAYVTQRPDNNEDILMLGVVIDGRRLTIPMGYYTKQEYRQNKGKQYHLGDPVGNIFSPQGVENIIYSFTAKVIKGLVAKAHKRKEKVIANFYEWRAPEYVTEENYKHYYHDVIENDDRDDVQLLKDTDVHNIILHISNNRRVLVKRVSGDKGHPLWPTQDQLLPDLGKKDGNEKEKANFNYWKKVYSSNLMHLIDLGFDGVRVDLAHGFGVNKDYRLFRELIEDSIAYCQNTYQRSFNFILETYEDHYIDGEPYTSFFRKWNHDLPYPAIKTYFSHIEKNLMALGHGDHVVKDYQLGKLMTSLHQLLKNPEHAASEMIAIASFDDHSLKDVANTSNIQVQALLELMLMLGKAGYNVLGLDRDLMGLEGELIPTVPGGNDHEEKKGIYYTHRVSTIEEFRQWLSSSYVGLIEKSLWLETMDKVNNYPEVLGLDVNVDERKVIFTFSDGQQRIYDFRKLIDHQMPENGKINIAPPAKVPSVIEQQLTTLNKIESTLAQAVGLSIEQWQNLLVGMNQGQVDQLKINNPFGEGRWNEVKDYFQKLTWERAGINQPHEVDAYIRKHGESLVNDYLRTKDMAVPTDGQALQWEVLVATLGEEEAKTYREQLDQSWTIREALKEQAQALEQEPILYQKQPEQLASSESTYLVKLVTAALTTGAQRLKSATRDLLNRPKKIQIILTLAGINSDAKRGQHGRLNTLQSYYTTLLTMISRQQKGARLSLNMPVSLMTYYHQLVGLVNQSLRAPFERLTDAEKDDPKQLEQIINAFLAKFKKVRHKAPDQQLQLLLKPYHHYTKQDIISIIQDLQHDRHDVPGFNQLRQSMLTDYVIYLNSRDDKDAIDGLSDVMAKAHPINRTNQLIELGLLKQPYLNAYVNKAFSVAEPKDRLQAMAKGLLLGQTATAIAPGLRHSHMLLPGIDQSGKKVVKPIDFSLFYRATTDLTALAKNSRVCLEFLLNQVMVMEMMPATIRLVAINDLVEKADEQPMNYNLIMAEEDVRLVQQGLLPRAETGQVELLLDHDVKLTDAVRHFIGTAVTTRTLNKEVIKENQLKSLSRAGVKQLYLPATAKLVGLNIFPNDQSGVIYQWQEKGTFHQLVLYPMTWPRPPNDLVDHTLKPEDNANRITFDEIGTRQSTAVNGSPERADLVFNLDEDTMNSLQGTPYLNKATGWQRFLTHTFKTLLGQYHDPQRFQSLDMQLPAVLANTARYLTARGSNPMKVIGYTQPRSELDTTNYLEAVLALESEVGDVLQSEEHLMEEASPLPKLIINRLKRINQLEKELATAANLSLHDWLDLGSGQENALLEAQVVEILPADLQKKMDDLNFYRNQMRNFIRSDVELNTAGRWPWLQQVYNDLEYYSAIVFGARWGVVIGQAIAPAIIETGLLVGLISFSGQMVLSSLFGTVLTSGLAFWISLAIALGLWQVGHLPWQKLETQSLLSFISNYWRYAITLPLVKISSWTVLASATVQVLADPGSYLFAMISLILWMTIHVVINLSKKQFVSKSQSRLDDRPFSETTQPLGAAMNYDNRLVQGANQPLRLRLTGLEQALHDLLRTILFSSINGQDQSQLRSLVAGMVFLITFSSNLIRSAIERWMIESKEKSFALSDEELEEMMQPLLYQYGLPDEKVFELIAKHGISLPRIKVGILTDTNRQKLEGSLGAYGGYVIEEGAFKILIPAYLLSVMNKQNKGKRQASTFAEQASQAIRLYLLTMVISQAARVYADQQRVDLLLEKIKALSHQIKQPKYFVPAGISLLLGLTKILPRLFSLTVHRFVRKQAPQSYLAVQLRGDNSVLAKQLNQSVGEAFQAFVLYAQAPTAATEEAMLKAFIQVMDIKNPMQRQLAVKTFSQLCVNMGTNLDTIGQWKATGDSIVIPNMIKANHQLRRAMRRVFYRLPIDYKKQWKQPGFIMHKLSENSA